MPELPTSIIPRLQNRLLSEILGIGIGFAAHPALNVYFRPLRQRLEQEATNVVLNPQTLALGVVHGVIDYLDAVNEAKASGISQGRLDKIITSLSRPPGFADILALWRRGPDLGGLTDAEAREAVGFSDVKDRYVAPLLTLKRVLNSADDLAQMVVQGILSHDEGRDLALLMGTEATEFDRLYRLHGNPPGLHEMLDLWRRGVIDENDRGAIPGVTRGIRQSRLKPEWTEPVKALRYVLESPGQLVHFMVRQVFDAATRDHYQLDAEYPDNAEEQGVRIGLSPELMHRYWQSHWSLPSMGEAREMLHRRPPGSDATVIDTDEFRRLLRLKEAMPFWRERLLQIVHTIPNYRLIPRLVAAGVWDAARAKRAYLNLGFDEADANDLRDMTIARKQQPERDLTKAEIAAEYEARMIGRPAAVERLKALRFSDAEAGVILDLADFRARKSYRDAVVAIVHGRYVKGAIDRATAASRLDRIGLPPEGRDALLDLWLFERDESPTLLTEAQVAAALKKKIITEAQFRAYLARLRYEPAGIDILYSLAAG